MGNNIGQLDRYDSEIKKVIDVLDTLHKQFGREKEELEAVIHRQQEQIEELTHENETLHQFSTQTETKIEEMVSVYTREIESLKGELRELRDQSVIGEESMRELKDITAQQNLVESQTIREKPSQVTEVDPQLSQVSNITVP